MKAIPKFNLKSISSLLVKKKAIKRRPSLKSLEASTCKEESSSNQRGQTQPKQKNVAMPTTTTTTKRVRFNESGNIIYTSDSRLQPTFNHETWYTQQELRGFHQARRALHNKMQRHERSNKYAVASSDPRDHWSRGHLEIYQALCSYHHVSPVLLQDKLYSTQIVFQLGTLGMERTSISPIAKDACGRRVLMYDAIKRLQQQNGNRRGCVHVQEEIKQVYQFWSKPCVLYAHYVAVVSASAKLC